MFLSKIFAATLEQANLANKNDIVIIDILQKRQILMINEKIQIKQLLQTKARHIEVETKLDDIEKKLKIISTKGLTADLINKYSILNRAKYFSADRLQI